MAPRSPTGAFYLYFDWWAFEVQAGVADVGLSFPEAGLVVCEKGFGLGVDSIVSGVSLVYVGFRIWKISRSWTSRRCGRFGSLRFQSWCLCSQVLGIPFPCGVFQPAESSHVSWG